VRVLAELAHATCAVARHDSAGAREHVRTGLRDLRRHRSTLAAADASAAVAIHAEELAALGLRLALRDGGPDRVLESIELVRTGRRRDAPARPLADAAAAAELAELRSVVAELRRQEAGGGDTVELLHRQRDLERAVHRRSLRTARGPADVVADADPPPLELGTLRTALDGRRLVELAAVDDRLVAVVVDARGGRVLHLAPYADVRAVCATIASALRATMAPSRSGATAGARDLLYRSASALDEALRPALLGEGPTVLVVPPALNAVPWRLLAALGDRPVVVAPSATWWCEAAQAASQPGPTVTVAGPRLVEASAEAQAVASCYVGAAVLDGPAATTAAVVGAFATAGTVHVASHAHVRRDNPLWSSLELADGPLCVYDLQPLPRTPGVVVLSGCETAVGVPAGHGLLGLANAFLEQGTTSLVASVCPLPDTPDTRAAMTTLHGHLAGGVPASAALAATGPSSWEDPAAMLAATLTCFGSR
jgi:hypothetical protein